MKSEKGDAQGCSAVDSDKVSPFTDLIKGTATNCGHCGPLAEKSEGWVKNPGTATYRGHCGPRTESSHGLEKSSGTAAYCGHCRPLAEKGELVKYEGMPTYCGHCGRTHETDKAEGTATHCGHCGPLAQEKMDEGTAANCGHCRPLGEKGMPTHCGHCGRTLETKEVTKAGTATSCGPCGPCGTKVKTTGRGKSWSRRRVLGRWMSRVQKARVRLRRYLKRTGRACEGARVRPKARMKRRPEKRVSTKDPEPDRTKTYVRAQERKAKLRKAEPDAEALEVDEGGEAQHEQDEKVLVQDGEILEPKPAERPGNPKDVHDVSDVSRVTDVAPGNVTLSVPEST